MKYVPCCMKFSCMCISLRSEVRWNPINLPWSIFQKLIDQLSVWTPCPHFFFYFFSFCTFGQIKTVSKEEKRGRNMTSVVPSRDPSPQQSLLYCWQMSFFQTFAGLTAAFVNTAGSHKFSNGRTGIGENSTAQQQKGASSIGDKCAPLTALFVNFSKEDFGWNSNIPLQDNNKPCNITDAKN